MAVRGTEKGQMNTGNELRVLSPIGCFTPPEFCLLNLRFPISPWKLPDVNSRDKDPSEVPRGENEIGCCQTELEMGRRTRSR